MRRRKAGLIVPPFYAPSPKAWLGNRPLAPGRNERAYLETIAHLPEAETPGAEAQALILELLEAIARRPEGLKPKVRRAFLLAQCEGLRLGGDCIQPFWGRFAAQRG